MIFIGPFAYRRDRVIYLNAFSGDATTEFPSTLQMARGGVSLKLAPPLIIYIFSIIIIKFVDCVAFTMHLKILADAMGLGKTIMTISLLLTHSGHGLSVSYPTSQSSSEDIEVPDISDLPKKVPKFSGFDKLLKQKNTVEDGGCLIICPMTLLGQWKVVIVILKNINCSSAYVHEYQFLTCTVINLLYSRVI